MQFPISIPPKKIAIGKNQTNAGVPGWKMPGESAQAGAEKKAATGTAGFKLPLIAAAGGLVTAALLVAMLGRGPGASSHPELSMVAQNEIDVAAATLAPGSSAQIADEAKRCKAPMAFVTISKQPDSQGGTIRIKAGTYVSPPFQVTAAPQRVAIPYPAPYPAGKGVLAVEGEASGIIISLYPNWRIEALHGLQTLDVWWETNKPC
jgi:hypothetical protein